MTDPPRLLDSGADLPAAARTGLEGLARTPALPPGIRASVGEALAKAAGAGAGAGAGAAASSGLLGKILAAGLVVAGAGGLGLWRSTHRAPAPQQQLRSAAATRALPAPNPVAAPAPVTPAPVAPLLPPSPAPVAEPPAAPLPSAPARAARVRPACTRDLAAETTLLERAQRSLASNPRGTLEALAEHARSFPDACAQLRVERELLAVRALQRAGDTPGARARLQRLQRTSLDALGRSRVEHLLRELGS